MEELNKIKCKNCKYYIPLAEVDGKETKFNACVMPYFAKVDFPEVEWLCLVTPEDRCEYFNER